MDKVRQGLNGRADERQLKIQGLSGVKRVPGGQGRVEHIRTRGLAEFGGISIAWWRRRFKDGYIKASLA